jgi:uncharacterized OB-fold protein
MTGTGVQRPVPAVDPDTEFFWTSGRDGILRFQRCQDCQLFIHPPRPVCRRCLSANLAPAPVAGRGTVFSYTVNQNHWWDGMPAPYTIALVEMDDHPELRFLTNLVDADPDDVFVGMPVEVVFERHGPVWVPLFRPVA